MKNESFVIQELLRCLKSGGIFLVNVPINEVLQDPKHVRRYTAEHMKSLFESFDLQPVLFYECNRWDGFFARIEAGQPSILFRIMTRLSRAILALLPERAWSWLENYLLRDQEYQQLVAVARKA